jgi:hypothetical protein
MGHTPETAKPSLPWQHRPIELPRIHEDVLNRAWQTDPYVSDPQSINTVISSFFVHIDSTMALRFLPEKAFKSWVASHAHRKSPEDLMLVYSILAMGVALSGGPKNIAYEYAQVAYYAQHRASLSIQLVQTRILLAMYYLSISRTNDASNMTIAAISTATCLKLNLELEQSKESDLTEYPFNLNKAGYAETRRRTFWSCFLLERLDGTFPNRAGFLHAEDIFICLPSSNDSFDDQAEVSNPKFNPYTSSLPKGTEQLVGTSGHLVQLVAIWGEVMTTIHRGVYRQASPNPDIVSFIDRIHRRLGEWRESLAPELCYNTANMDLAASNGTLGSFIMIHILHHMICIKIHRHVHPARQVASSSRKQHISQIHEHAIKISEIVTSLDTVLKVRRAVLSAPPPLVTTAILEVVDVLSAEGHISELPALINGLSLSKAIVDVTTTVWDDAKQQKLAMEVRLDKLDQLRTTALDTSTNVLGCRVFTIKEEDTERRLPAELLWQISDPIDSTFPKSLDVVYANVARSPPVYT